MIGLLLLTPMAFAPARPMALAPRAPMAASPSLAMAPPLAPSRARLAASPRMDTATPGPDYKLAGSFVLLGALTLAAPWLVGGFLLLFGILLVVQTLRIRFVFDDEAIEVKTIDLLSADGALAAITGGPAPLEKTGENFAVGGENRWRCVFARVPRARTTRCRLSAVPIGALTAAVLVAGTTRL